MRAHFKLSIFQKNRDFVRIQVEALLLSVHSGNIMIAV
jgi:hypothetical protein